MQILLDGILHSMVNMDTVLSVHEMLLSFLVPVVLIKVGLVKPMLTMELLGVILVMI